MGAQGPPELLGIHTSMPGVVPAGIDKALQYGGPTPARSPADVMPAYARPAFATEALATGGGTRAPSKLLSSEHCGPPVTQGTAASIRRRRPSRLHPGITQEAAPNESQRGPKPL